MRRSTVLSLNRMHGLDFFVKNKLSVFICLLFVVGVAIGVFSCSGSESVAKLSEGFLSDFIASRAEKSFLKIFLHSGTSALAMMLSAFLCGGSLLGFVLVPLLVMWNGFTYGIMSAYVCAEFALKGIAFNAVVLIPPCVVFFVCFLSAARHAVMFSLQIARLTLPKTPPSCLYVQFKGYSARFALSGIFCIVSALADAMLSRALIRYFDFTF